MSDLSHDSNSRQQHQNHNPESRTPSGFFSIEGQMEENEFLDVKAMCEFLGCGEDKVRQEVREHRLPTPIKRGRKNYWFRKSVVVALEKMRAATEKNIRATAFRQ